MQLVYYVLPRFEWQTAIRQSARTIETHQSFDRQFYPKAQNLFLSMNSRYMHCNIYIYNIYNIYVHSIRCICFQLAVITQACRHQTRRKRRRGRQPHHQLPTLHQVNSNNLAAWCLARRSQRRFRYVRVVVTVVSDDLVSRRRGSSNS